MSTKDDIFLNVQRIHPKAVEELQIAQHLKEIVVYMTMTVFSLETTDILEGYGIMHQFKEADKYYRAIISKT